MIINPTWKIGGISRIVESVLSIDQQWVDLQAGWTMARKLRLEYEGAINHLMSRGDRR